MSANRNSNNSRSSTPWPPLALVAIVVIGIQGPIVAIVHNLMLMVIGVTGILVAGAVAALGLILRDHRGTFTWHPPEPPRGALRPQERTRIAAPHVREIEAARVVPGQVLGAGETAREPQPERPSW